MASLPLILGIFMAVVSPAYFRPLLTWPVGVACLGVLVVLTVVNVLVLGLGFRMAAGGKVGRGILLMVAAFFLLTFPSIWIVLLGPALVILTKGPK